MQKKVANPNSKTKLPPAHLKSPPPKLEQIKEENFAPRLSTKPHTTRHENEARSPKIPMNVNFYRHLINDKYSSEHDLEWVLKLRSPNSENKSTFKNEPTTTQPFSFDGRGIEAQKNGRATSELDSKNQPHQLQHLYRHRIGATPSQGPVYFETGLRNYGSSSDKLRDLERTWRNAPKKDKQEYPSLYPSYNETLKIKSWSTKNLAIETHTGFEGSLNYPKYGEIYDRQTKNVSDVRHLLKAPGKLMATADWELSMRHYGDRAKPKEFTEHVERQKVLGQLKKVNRKTEKV